MQCGTGGSPAHCPECGVPVDGPQVRQLRYWTYACPGDQVALRSPPAAACRRPTPASTTPKGGLRSSARRLEKQRQPVAAASSRRTRPASQAFARGRGRYVRHGAGAGRAARRDLLRARPRRGPRRHRRRRARRGGRSGKSCSIPAASSGCWDSAGHCWSWAWSSGWRPWESSSMPRWSPWPWGWATPRCWAAAGSITLRSRYQTAGRALTLLACLVMPLNLYFYHAYDLITLDGHLWLAALVCCLLYAASAWVLRDRLFVYVLGRRRGNDRAVDAGHMGKFWEIARPLHPAGRHGTDLPAQRAGLRPGRGALLRGSDSAWPSSGRGRPCWPPGCSCCWGPRLPATGSTSPSSSSSMSVP